VGVVEQDVGCLQRGVGEETCRHEISLPFGRFVFELGHAAQFAERHGALHDPRELRVLRQMTLHKDRGDGRVETDRKEHGGERERLVAKHVWRFGDGQGM